MIDSNLVLIVGAGASAEYGMPVGAELARRVADLLALNDRSTAQAAEASLFAKVVSEIDPNAFQTNREIASRLAAAARQFASIDEALHFAADSEIAVRIGKLAISQAIVSAESQITDNVQARGGTLHPDRYLTHLLDLATGGRKRSEHQRFFSNLSIINFNYDRVVEETLFSALVQHYSLESAHAIQAIESISVIRPYGSVGGLPWQRSGKDLLEFGPRRRNVAMISKAANNIRTFTEGVTETGIQEQISEMLERASAVIVLGFGYHTQNLSILKTRGYHGFSDTMQVFATVSGINEHNHTRIKHALAERFGLRAQNHPSCLPMRAAEMFNALRFSIAAAVAR